MARKKKKSNWDNMEPQKSSAAQFLTYVASVGNVDERYEIRYEDENIWMSQKMLAAVYGVEVPNIAYHLRKLFADAELDKSSVIKEILITADDGKNYRVNHYDLRVIIALGFKIDNEKAIAFRKWANQIVTEYTIKGWVMDDQRLKDGTPIADKYFDIVFIDTNSGVNRQSMKIVSECDVVMVTVRQGGDDLEAVVNNEILKDKKVYYLFGSYDPYSKYTLKNLRKMYKALTKDNSGGFPHCTQYMDAIADNRILKFMNANLEADEDHPDFEFFEAVRGVAAQLVDLAEKRR